MGELIAIVAFGVLALVVMLLKENRLADPSNFSAIHVDQLAQSHVLPNGPVAAALLRQSGGVYRELGIFPSAGAALAEIEKSFRRAGIGSVAVVKNTQTMYEVARLHHSHRGRAEGKKLGGAVLVPA